MSFDVILSTQAAASLKALPARVRSIVRDALETHLRYEPAKTSRSRVKRLRGLRLPQYRLRVGKVRIFYDIVDSSVEILAIVAKSEAEQWLNQYGEPEQSGFR